MDKRLEAAEEGLREERRINALLEWAMNRLEAKFDSRGKITWLLAAIIAGALLKYLFS